MSLRISVPMPARLTHHVLSSALESSYGSMWLRGYSRRTQWDSDAIDRVALHIGAQVDSSDPAPKHSRIGAARIARALELMLTSGNVRHAERAGRVLAGSFDAPDADCVLQFAAFEEVIYG